MLSTALVTSGGVYKAIVNPKTLTMGDAVQIKVNKYTAPSNGIFIFDGSSGDSYTMGYGTVSFSMICEGDQILPAPKGAWIQSQGGSTQSISATMTAYFIPFK